MSVKASELPDLIAAAVKKAVADKVITDESLQALVHRPFTIGILPFPPPAERELVVGTPQPFPWRTIGYVLDSIEELRTPEKLTPTEE